MDGITQTNVCRKPADDARRTDGDLREELRHHCSAVEALASRWSESDEEITFRDFELALRELLFALGRVAVALFLELREQRMSSGLLCETRAGQRYRRAEAVPRNLMTLFGVVRYWRIYMRATSSSSRHGYHPLDVALGLTADRFSWNVLMATALLATRLSFAQARSSLLGLLPAVPSTEVIEQTVLGLGHHTEAWFADAPAPEGDGEVLVVMVDSKGAPTATQRELERRRGKRRAPTETGPASARHRSRSRRSRHPKQPRKAKGDKSKNAKMATTVVMYTLRREGEYLVGPINRWRYTSFAPKRRAFVVARREADKRGFQLGSGKIVQVVTDGDDDLARYTQELFADAIHTIDIIHVIEKLWEVATCLHPEGSDELRQWVDLNKSRLYSGDAPVVLLELKQALASIPKTGPGNKKRRARVSDVIRYIEKRLEKMRYDKLIEMDLEVSTGLIEGTVKNVVGRRCDQGGMRWIKERAESVVQLRCIELNGDWDAFTAFVHDRMRTAAQDQGVRVRLQTQTPAALPSAMAIAA